VRSRKGSAAARNEITGAFLVSDELWGKIAPLLPVRMNTHRFGGGRPPVDDRKCLNGIFFVLRTGCQWNALIATGICASSTAHDRFQQWLRQGVFLNFWKAGLMEYDELKGLDWKWLSMDSTMGKVPLGGEKTGGNPTDRGKSGSKRSVLSDAAGVPVGLVIDGANRARHEAVRGDTGKHRGGTSRARAGSPAGALSGQRLRLRGDFARWCNLMVSSRISGGANDSGGSVGKEGKSEYKMHKFRAL
jgi:transposase